MRRATRLTRGTNSPQPSTSKKASAVQAKGVKNTFSNPPSATSTPKQKNGGRRANVVEPEDSDESDCDSEATTVTDEDVHDEMDVDDLERELSPVPEEGGAVGRRDDDENVSDEEVFLNRSAAREDNMNRTMNLLSQSFQELINDKYKQPPNPMDISMERITDPEIAKRIYDDCIQLFAEKKITPKNAFELKFFECMGTVLNIEIKDTTNMANFVKLVETGAKIYSCRVEEVCGIISDLQDHVVEKKEKKRKVLEDRQDGDGSVLISNESVVDADSSYVLSREDFDYLENGVAIPKKWDDYSELNPNIVPESQLQLDVATVENSGEIRRLTLNDKFSAYCSNLGKFDYAGMVFPKEELEEKRKVPANMNEKLIPFNPNIINRAALNNLPTLEFHRFGKQSNQFDCKKHNVLGQPIGTNGTPIEERVAIILQKRLEQKGQTQPATAPMAMDVGVFDDFDYPATDDPADYPEDGNVENNEPEFLQDDYEPLGPDGKLKPISWNDIRTLQDHEAYFNMLKQKILNIDLMNWNGPTIIRNRQTKFGSTTRVTKKKVQPEPINLLEIDWKDKAFKFSPAAEHVIELDENAFEKWTGTPATLPTLPIESTDVLLDDDVFDDAYDTSLGRSYKEVSFNRMTRFFVDSGRTIFGKSVGRFAENVEDDDDEDPLGFCRSHAEELGFQNDDEPEPMHNESFRDAGVSFNGAAVNGNVGSEGEQMDEATLKRMTALYPGFNFTSTVDEYPLTKLSDMDTLRFSSTPRPINMQKVKNTMKLALADLLELDEYGETTKDEDTETDMATLTLALHEALDENTKKYISPQIILVAVLHVVIELDLFMENGSESPKIICRGRKWVHGEHIPGVDPEDVLILTAPNPAKRQRLSRAATAKASAPEPVKDNTVDEAVNLGEGGPMETSDEDVFHDAMSDQGN